MSQEPSSKRRSSSRHESDRLERLAKHGVFMTASNHIQQSSKDLCLSFLDGDQTPRQFPCYPPNQIANVLARVQPLNEARLYRDITPWVVPSAENLHYSGETVPDYIGEELQADWTRCATMGETRPKPDYTAGLLRKAFTQEEIDKLENYASFERPWLFTPNLCFPFLMCEAKTGQVGLDKADRQNIHSASIALYAIIELHKAAFGTTAPEKMKELDGQVLAFSVSHNNKLVNLYGHYAVLDNDVTGRVDFYRYDIKMFSLTMEDGADRFKPYNFVLNLYRKFAPKHQQRIKDAVAFLPTPAQRTGLSFSTSDLTLEEMASQQDFQGAASQDDSAFQRPADRSSVLQKNVMAKLVQQIERQRQESKEREERMRQESNEEVAMLLQHTNKLLEQLERSKEREEKLEQESKEREEKLEQESKEREEKLKQESKEREKKLERQMEQQMEQQTKQMEQQQEIISLLKQARS